MVDDFTLTEPTPAAPSTRAEANRRREAARRARMRTKFGLGPEGVTCKSCAHLRRLGHHDSSYLKCLKYGVSHSEATDWRAKWPACGAYEAEQPA